MKAGTVGTGSSGDEAKMETASAASEEGQGVKQAPADSISDL